MKTRTLIIISVLVLIPIQLVYAPPPSPNELTEIYIKDCSPVDLESTIYGGNLQYVCNSSITNSIKAMVNADSDGTVTLEIPKFPLYSLTDDQCNTSNDFLVLVKGIEVASVISDIENTNSVTVDFAKGITEIEIIGTTIIPDPSPSQYCGIVERYEKQFLAPLDQIDRGVKPEFIRCNTGLVLIQKIDDTPACVTLDTKIELIIRGWADDDRLLLGCIGERVQKCYPEDKEEYRKALQHYYYESELESESENNLTIARELFQEKYDAVVKGTVFWCMGHKESYPIRYQCEIQVDSYIKYDGEKTGQLTVMAYRDSLNEDNQGTIFGLDYHEDKDYYEIMERVLLENED